MRGGRLAGLAIWILGLSCGSAEESSVSAPSTSGAESNKLALLVGINRYEDPNIRALSGALNDVDAMRDVLIGKFGFDESRILDLRNEEASGDAIREAFRTHLIDGVRGRDDVVVFYYSGHGSQVLDEPDGDESDGLDETLVPFDAVDAGRNDITDDEINALIRELGERTDNITFIFDSCNSGTGARRVGVPRRVERDLEPRTATRNVAVDESGMQDANVKYTLIAGALAEELASEHTADNGVTYGALTYFLTEALKRAPVDATYRDVMDVVRHDVTALYKNQHPQLEGTEADRVIFGDTTALPAKHVLASGGSTPGEVILEAGEIHGVTKDSVFAIYPPGSRRFDDSETPIAEATVVNVRPRSSTAVLDAEEEVEVPRGSRAVEREHSFACRQLWVSYLDPDRSEALRSIRDDLADYAFIRVVGPEEPYHVVLEHSDGTILMRAADGGVVLREDETTPGLTEVISEDVRKWAKWYNVLSIRNPSPSPNVRIDFTVEAESPEGVRRAPFAFVESPDAELEAGEIIVATIESRSNVDLYLHMLDLESDGTVSVLRSLEGDKKRLRKGENVTVRLRTTLPAGHDSVTDVLKVFATVSDVDFEFLEQNAIKRGERRSVGGRDSVEDLLACAALGAGSPERPLRLDRWATDERVVHVTRRQ